MENEGPAQETKLLSDQESDRKTVPTVKTFSRDRDTPPMTWKSVAALGCAMLLAAALIIGSLAWTRQSLTSHSPTVIQTPSGKFIGSPATANGGTYIAYKSIPFAKPPVGDLRFKRPQPLDQTHSPDDFINSEDYKKSCWSTTKTWPNPYYGEDCLYLNVYVPAERKTSGPLPVMVWIHGGGFVAGSTFPEPGKMVVRGEVIVVSVNYRLGIFGFLSNMDDALPSNNGLWDQYMAIKWVHDNIHHFDGNSSSITIFGESAGAISVGLHVISPVTAPYFHKAILQSGAMTSVINRSVQNFTAKFAELAGCRATPETSLGLCLRNVSVDTILRYSRPEFYVSNAAQRQYDFIWMPTVDGEFIVDEPLRLLNNHSFLSQNGVYDKDYIIGVLNDEGALIATGNFYNPIPISDLSNVTFFNELTGAMLTCRYSSKVSHSKAIHNAMNRFYAGFPTVTEPPSPMSVLELAADLIFVVPALEAALAISHQQANKQTKTYFYHFDYCPARKDLDDAPCFNHGDEVALEFPKTEITDPVLAQLSDTFISLLTSFASSSDPAQAVGCGWPVFEPEGKQYLRIAPNSDIRSDLYNLRAQFWLETVPCLINQHPRCI